MPSSNRLTKIKIPTPIFLKNQWCISTQIILTILKKGNILHNGI